MLKVISLIIIVVQPNQKKSFKGFEFSNQLVINRPIDEVFSFLSNFENMPKWNYYVMSVTKTSGGSIGVGTTFHQVRKSDQQDYRVTELKHPNIISIETLPPERHWVMQFKLEQQGESTILVDSVRVKAPWLIGLFVKEKIRKAVEQNLFKLKMLLEKGTVTLQDGRVVNL
jgi:uncharacterized membrane protein